MIRQRIDEDLDPLCAVLKGMGYPSDQLSNDDLGDWLGEYDAEQSWVFDQAPVTVVPTKNVVGHVQMHRPVNDPSVPYWCEHTKQSASSLLVIERHFVKPSTHDEGIGRYLLKESVSFIQERAKIPVLDLRRNSSFARDFYEKFGFEEVPADDPGVAPMIYTQ